MMKSLLYCLLAVMHLTVSSSGQEVDDEPGRYLDMAKSGKMRAHNMQFNNIDPDCYKCHLACMIRSLELENLICHENRM